MKKAMVIINPTSGGEKALDYKEKLENKAKEYFEHVETKITEKALDATHFAEEASREQYDAVVVFGGDGTVNEVISGIAERDYIPKLGIIPGGTGNLITKLLEINQDIDGAIDELDFDLTNKIDIEKRMTIILVISLVLVLCLRRFTMWRLRTRQNLVF